MGVRLKPKIELVRIACTWVGASDAARKRETVVKKCSIYPLRPALYSHFCAFLCELTAEEVWEKRRCHFVPVERGTAEFLSKSARFVDKGAEGRFRRFPFLTITSALISCLSVDVNQRVHHNACLAKMIISQRKGVIVMNFPYSTI